MPIVEPKLPTSTLLSLRQRGKIHPDNFRKKICLDRLQQDFGVDISTVKSHEFESKLRWYQEDYELFLAQIETSDESAEQLVNALFNKKNPSLIGGNKAIELFNNIRAKLPQTEISGLHIQIDLALLYLAIAKNDMSMMDDIFKRYQTQELKNWLLRTTINRNNENGTLLHFAAQLRKPDAIKKILSQFLTPEEKKEACLKPAIGQSNGTPVHFAAESGNFNAFKMMFEVSENPNNLPGLLISASLGDLSIFNFVWDSFINKEENKKLLPDLLSRAVRAGNSLVVEKIFELLSDNNEQVSNLALDNIYAAAGSKNIKTFKVVEHHLDQKINLNNETLLLCAAKSGMTDMIIEILTMYPTTKEKITACCARDLDDETPLHHSTRSGNPHAIKILLDMVGNNAEEQCLCLTTHRISLASLLRSAAESGNPDVISIILNLTTNEEEKYTACEETGYSNELALHCATMSGSLAAIKAILDIRPDSKKFYDSITIGECLGFSLETGSAQCLEYLLDYFDCSLWQLTNLLHTNYTNQGLVNLACQNLVIKKILHRLKAETEDNRQSYLNRWQEALQTLCAQCGNTTKWFASATTAENSIQAGPS